MSERERVRLALLVAVFSLLIGAVGGVVASHGGLVLGALGSVLIVFGVVGLGHAGAIGFGYMTPDVAAEGEQQDAGGD